MSLKVIPTNIGGFNLPFAQLQGPLSSLFQNQDPKNLLYPADLGSNPAMGHAVMFEVFDYTSGFVEGAQQVAAIVGKGITAEKAVNDPATAGMTVVENVAGNAATLGKLGLSTLTAATYKKKTKNKLANISLYMPDTLNMTYNSSYTDISLTSELGMKGYIGNAISDSLKANEKGGTGAIQSVLMNEYGKAGAAQLFGEKVLGSSAVGGLLQQAAGIYINPQMQLLYKGVGLRTFQLDFIFTPKTSQEAQTAKDICDSFAYYSLPGFGASGSGQSGQFLTPPQLFRISFKFLGKNDILGSVSSVFSSALSNSGLGFLNSTNPTSSVQNGATAKIMTVSDCVLENVTVDYAPNGWAAYNDGYPIQSTLTLQFKEIEMPTKESIKNSRVSSNYRNENLAAESGFESWNQFESQMNAERDN
jgi:hypothetical protein